MTNKPPTQEEVKKALAYFMRHAPDCTCDPAMGTNGECAFRDWVDAEETLLAALAAKDAENERLLWPLGKNICPMCRKKVRGADDLHTCYDAYDAVCSQLATAEARGDADDAEAFRKGHAAGFRTAIERLEDYAVTQDAGGSMVVYHAQDFLRAQADRREGSDE